VAAGRVSGLEATTWARLIGLARAVFKAWALVGGLILLGLVIMTAASALSNLVFNRPFRGDYEIIKHGVAIAAFAFLPYCQSTYANVTVDIFTERMSDRAKAAMVLLSSIIAAALAALLFRQMWLGMMDYIKYREVMTSLPIPLWTAFPPALASLALLFVAALITAAEGIAGVRRRGRALGY
jgi:TRAP-type C4-dicarboxylate transport system permease small subunit